MKKNINLIGTLMWSLVFIAVAFSYPGAQHTVSETLKGLCDKYKYDPHNIPNAKLNKTLKDLNKLRLSHKNNNLPTSSNNLQWIDSCTGLVMVEVKSRSFEKKLKRPTQSTSPLDKN
jgi:hypothetical protein